MKRLVTYDAACLMPFGPYEKSIFARLRRGFQRTVAGIVSVVLALQGMRVKSKWSKVSFRRRRVLSIQQQLRTSDEKASDSTNPQKMTSVEDATPVALISRDSLEQLSLQQNMIFNNGTDEFPVPELFTSLPPIRDLLVTYTSLSQDETAKRCLPLHAGPSRSFFDLSPQGIPRLNREDHVDFLNDAIQKAEPVPFDALRPWVVYWSLTGLSVLGENLEQWRNRVWETFSPLQNPGGGFGGGHGQISHAAPSYAVVLSLAMVGGNESLDMIDRRAL